MESSGPKYSMSVERQTPITEAISTPPIQIDQQGLVASILPIRWRGCADARNHSGPAASSRAFPILSRDRCRCVMTAACDEAAVLDAQAVGFARRNRLETSSVPVMTSRATTRVKAPTPVKVGTGAGGGTEFKTD